MAASETFAERVIGKMDQDVREEHEPAGESHLPDTDAADKHGEVLTRRLLHGTSIASSFGG